MGMGHATMVFDILFHVMVRKNRLLKFQKFLYKIIALEKLCENNIITRHSNCIVIQI